MTRRALGENSESGSERKTSEEEKAALKQLIQRYQISEDDFGELNGSHRKMMQDKKEQAEHMAKVKK